MSANEFKCNLYHAVIDLLWRQWTLLGIAGQVNTKNNGMVLDPEALLIFSAGFCRYDQRLYDLLPDWMCRYGSLINIQRLRALHETAAWKDTNSLGFLTALMAEFEKGRWKKSAFEFRTSIPATPISMFLDWQNDEPLYIPKPDALALHYGFLRSEYFPSGKVASNLPGGVSTLLLRMRALFGVSARAETLLILLDRGVCRIQEIADSSGFAWKSVQDVLGELCSGEFVSAISGEKRGKHYTLKSPEKFKRLLEIDRCHFPDWQKLYDALGILWDTLSNPLLAGVSEVTFQREIERSFEERLQSYFLHFRLDSLRLLNSRTVMDLPLLLQTL